MHELRTRIIPVLLLSGLGLVKTRKFSNPTYLGDPMNTFRIFNDMEVDEIVLLDINATATGNTPQFETLREIAAEALFPLAYGGGVRSVNIAVQIIESGYERIVVNNACATEPHAVREMCTELGSSSIVASIDVGTSWMRNEVVKVQGGRKKIKTNVEDWARQIEDLGVGEIMVNAIERDGEMCGYDLDLVHRISSAVSVPVIACGGASTFADFSKVIKAGASAAAGGAVFVFKGKHRGVLIQYPSNADRKELLCKN